MRLRFGSVNRYFIDVSYPFSKLLPAKLRVKAPALYEFWADMRSRGWKLSAVDVPLSAMQSAGYTELYAYRYDWDEQADNYLVPFSTILGATHASEIAFIMGAPMFGEIGDYMYPDTESAREMTEVMMSAWGSFAREGAPRLPNEIDWPRYKASQPASMPQAGRDAITVGAEVVQALQTIVSRKLAPGAGAVVSVTEFLTDGQRNVLPGYAQLKGDVRARLPDDRRIIEKLMRQIVEGTSVAHGVSSDLSFKTEFIETINSDGPTDAATKVSRALGLETIGDREPMSFL